MRICDIATRREGASLYPCILAGRGSVLVFGRTTAAAWSAQLRGPTIHGIAPYQIL